MTFPTNEAELQTALMDAVKAGKSDEVGAITANYAKHVAVNDPTIQAQIKEQAQATVIEMMGAEYSKLADKVGTLTAPEKASTYSPLYNKAAVGAPLDNLGFENAGDYLKTVWHANGNPTAEQRERLQKIYNYQEKVPSEGGFLVPEEYRAELLRISLETSVVRPRARVVPMGSATLRYPSIDTTSNASSVYGGIIGYWTEEGAELTESAASFGAVKLEAQKLTALAHVTNELIRDTGGAFNQFVNSSFPEAISWFEDVAFLTGNGVGQPLGALNAGNTALVAVAKETSQAADTVNWLNVTKMYARMLPSSLRNAVWIVSPDVFPQLANMTVNVKNVAGTENVGGSAVWLPDGTGAPTLTLLGRPVIISEKVSVVGDLGDINFVDLSMYLIGDSQRMIVDSSPHVKFTSDKTTYRVIERVDGRPWLQSAITPKNGGATLSPFVQLAERA
jgi:HK97 family phage major capsid protein